MSAKFVEHDFLLVSVDFETILLNAKSNKKKGKRPPEPSGRLPIIGHLHLLGADKLLHRTFAEMADKYGPIFWLRLGLEKALVVSSWEVAKECYTTNDKVIATRPSSFAVKIMGYDQALLPFAPYGPYWRDVRKLAMTELLSNRQLEMLKHVRESEVNFFIKELYGQWALNKNSPVLVEMKERFGNLAMKVVLRAIAGKRYFGDEPKRGKKALDDLMFLVGLFMVSDFIPFLGWLDRLRGYTAEMKRIAKEVDHVLGSWVEEHRQQRLSATFDGDQQDFIHAMLSMIDDGDPDTIIKGTCLSLILGGYDSESITLQNLSSIEQPPCARKSTSRAENPCRKASASGWIRYKEPSLLASHHQGNIMAPSWVTFIAT